VIYTLGKSSKLRQIRSLDFGWNYGQRLDLEFEPKFILTQTISK